MAGVRCMLMRGGTSKGAYFLPADLPADHDERDQLLMEIMGTPDPRQIDGIGGAHPLTSKVAIVSAAENDDVDVEYLFLQVGVDEAMVTDRQNCGNLLAGVGPFALERGLIDREDGDAEVRIRMLNTDGVATARFQVSKGEPVYSGATSISGVPGTAGEIRLYFEGTATSPFPTGNVVDRLSGVPVTLVDSGMPVVVLEAEDVGISGYENCSDLESNESLRAQLEEIRLEAGPLMGLGDVSGTTVPKLTMVAPPREGGHVCTRTFIPHRCHQAIGVLGAVSAATGCVVPGTVGHDVLRRDALAGDSVLLEHPSGIFEAVMVVEGEGDDVTVSRAGIVRTARKLMDGLVFPRARS